MKFWDSSAIVPLLVDEETTASMRQVLIQDPAIAVWLFTGVELLSALGRLGRQSAALNDLLPGLRADVSSFLEHVVTVTPTNPGTYSIICNEYCGVNHHTMASRLYVVK